MKLFDASPDLIKAVKEVMEGKKMSKDDIAALAGDKKKFEADDLAALRAGKHKHKHKKKHHVKEEEILDERNKENKFKKDLYVAKKGVEHATKNWGFSPEDHASMSRAFGHDKPTERDNMKSLLIDYKRRGRAMTKKEIKQVDEREMTSTEKKKEAAIKSKVDDSDMKKNMMDKYGKERGKNIYFATIRKKAMTKEEVEFTEGSTWGVDSPKRKKGQYASDDGRHVAKVHKKEDEYVVSIHSDGKHNAKADYFTDDKEDAHGTAKAMLAHAVKHAKPLKEETSLVSKIINKYTK